MRRRHFVSTVAVIAPVIPPGNWILLGGIWNDLGLWIDTALWAD